MSVGQITQVVETTVEANISTLTVSVPQSHKWPHERVQGNVRLFQGFIRVVRAKLETVGERLSSMCPTCGNIFVPLVEAMGQILRKKKKDHACPI